MDALRRSWLVRLGACSIMPSALVRAALAQGDPRRVIDVRIERRRVVAPSAAIRVTQGDEVERSWTSDEPVELHLHGYDLKVRARPARRPRWSSRHAPSAVFPSPATAGAKVPMLTIR